MQIFYDIFSKYIQKEDTLIIAVSGGVDSMILLDLVSNVHPKGKIIVAHFDHSLRGDESDGDVLFVEEYAQTRGLIFTKEKLDIRILSQDEKSSIETTARKYRYNFFLEVARKYGAQYILTAHHQDDRIETALFHLIRGTKLGGIHALSEIAHFDDSISVFRPLLRLSKKELLRYATEKNILYREDSSNRDTEYLRNTIRHNILPEFSPINPEYRRALSGFIDYSEELKNWIDEQVRDFLGESHDFALGDFDKKSPFFQKEIIRYLYEYANRGTVGLSEGNIEEIRRYILTANGGTEKKLGKLLLRKKNKNISYSSTDITE